MKTLLLLIIPLSIFNFALLTNPPHLLANKAGVNIASDYGSFSPAAELVGPNGWVVALGAPGDCSSLSNMTGQGINLIVRGSPGDGSREQALAWCATLGMMNTNNQAVYFMPWNEPNGPCDADFGLSPCASPQEVAYYVNELSSCLSDAGLLGTKVRLLSPMINGYAGNQDSYYAALQNIPGLEGTSRNLYDEESGGVCSNSNPWMNSCSASSTTRTGPVFGVESGVVIGNPTWNDPAISTYLNTAYDRGICSDITMLAPFHYDPEHQEPWNIFSAPQTRQALTRYQSCGPSGVPSDTSNPAQFMDWFSQQENLEQCNPFGSSCAYATDSIYCSSQGSGSATPPGIPVGPVDGTLGSCAGQETEPLTSRPSACGQCYPYTPHPVSSCAGNFDTIATLEYTSADTFSCSGDQCEYDTNQCAVDWPAPGWDCCKKDPNAPEDCNPCEDCPNPPANCEAELESYQLLAGPFPWSGTFTLDAKSVILPFAGNNLNESRETYIADYLDGTIGYAVPINPPLDPITLQFNGQPHTLAPQKYTDIHPADPRFPSYVGILPWFTPQEELNQLKRRMIHRTVEADYRRAFQPVHNISIKSWAGDQARLMNFFTLPWEPERMPPIPPSPQWQYSWDTYFQNFERWKNLDGGRWYRLWTYVPYSSREDAPGELNPIPQPPAAITQLSSNAAAITQSFNLAEPPPAPPATPAGPHFSLSPPTSSTTTNRPLTINLLIDTHNTPTTSAEAILEFNPQILQISHVSYGSLYSFTTHHLDNSTGTLAIAGLFTNSVSTFSGTGTLATLTLTTLSPGTSPLTFRCQPGATDDSNITQASPLQDIINCAANISGSYTVTPEITQNQNSSPLASSTPYSPSNQLETQNLKLETNPSSLLAQGPSCITSTDPDWDTCLASGTRCSSSLCCFTASDCQTTPTACGDFCGADNPSAICPSQCPCGFSDPLYGNFVCGGPYDPPPPGPYPPPPGSSCTTASDCTDADPCTQDVCNQDNQCENPEIPNCELAPTPTPVPWVQLQLPHLTRLYESGKRLRNFIKPRDANLSTNNASDRQSPTANNQPSINHNNTSNLPLETGNSSLASLTPFSPPRPSPSSQAARQSPETVELAANPSNSSQANATLVYRSVESTKNTTPPEPATNPNAPHRLAQSSHQPLPRYLAQADDDNDGDNDSSIIDARCVITGTTWIPSESKWRCDYNIKYYTTPSYNLGHGCHFQPMSNYDTFDWTFVDPITQPEWNWGWNNKGVPDAYLDPGSTFSISAGWNIISEGDCYQQVDPKPPALFLNCNFTAPSLTWTQCIGREDDPACQCQGADVFIPQPPPPAYCGPTQLESTPQCSGTVRPGPGDQLCGQATYEISYDSETFWNANADQTHTTVPPPGIDPPGGDATPKTDFFGDCAAEYRESTCGAQVICAECSCTYPNTPDVCVKEGAVSGWLCQETGAEYLDSNLCQVDCPQPCTEAQVSTCVDSRCCGPNAVDNNSGQCQTASGGSAPPEDTSPCCSNTSAPNCKNPEGETRCGIRPFGSDTVIGYDGNFGPPTTLTYPATREIHVATRLPFLGSIWDHLANNRRSIYKLITPQNWYDFHDGEASGTISYTVGGAGGAATGFSLSPVSNPFFFPHLGGIQDATTFIRDCLVNPNWNNGCSQLVPEREEEITCTEGIAIPTRIKGTNYYPRNHPWAIFTDWDPTQISQELNLAKDLDINLIRTFVNYPIDQTSLNHIKEFLDIAGSKGIKVLLSLFDNYSNYPQEGSPEEAKNITYLQQLTNTLGNHCALFGWDVKNEPDHWTSGGPGDIEANQTDWLRRMAKAIRNLDPHSSLHPITVGLIFPNSNLVDHGGGRRRTIECFTDFLSFHYYPRNYPDSPLQGEIQNLQSQTQKPIWVEEVGLHTCDGPACQSDPNTTPHSEAEQASYYNQYMTAIQNTGAEGIIQWTLVDFTPNNDWDEGMYGLYRYNYSPKPAAAIYRDGFTTTSFSTCSFP